jgi:uncharacterized protein (TIGR03437 family)
MSQRVLITSAVCLAAAASVLHAQRLFVEPGASANSQAVQVLATSPLTSITGFQSGAGTFLVLGLPDGSKYYAIGSSTSQSVTAVDSAFQVPRDIAALSQPPTAAVLSPDGRRLAVAAGTLHIFDTASDTDLVPGGINVGSGISVIDVAFGLDGTTLYSLGVTAPGVNASTQINTIDVASNLVTGNMGFHGSATSISVAPNGLIYVTLLNELIDINPTTFAQNPAGPITVNALPGRPAFTPDGKFAVIANQTPSTGSSVLAVSLANRSVVGTGPSLQFQLDSLLVTGTDTLLGYSNSTQTAYQILVGSTGALSVTTFGNGTNSSFTALATSNEVPLGGRSFIDSVFAVTGANIVEQVDPQSGNIKSTSTLPTGMNVGALSYARPAVTNSIPVTLLQYGGGQTLGNNTTSAPIVLRVLDSNSLPISGVAVAFSTNGVGSTVSPTTVTTTSTGYAVTYLTTGTINGQLQVTATTGPRTAVYTMTVGTSVGPTAGGLTFVAGQGQVLPEGENTNSGIAGSNLSVLVTDTNGNPLPNTPVTFLITEGDGTLSLPSSQGADSQTVNTGTNGVATVDFLAPGTLAGGDQTRGFGQTQVTASAPSTNSLVFTITITPLNGAPTFQQVAPQVGTTITGQVNQVLPGALQYQIVSSTGYAIPGVGVNLSTQNAAPSLPSAKCNDPSGNGVLSDGTGRITCDLVIGPRVGKTQITANIGYSINMQPFELVVNPGPPAAVNILQGNNQSAYAGATLPTTLVVQVTDSGGNVLVGAPVTWSVVTAGTATLGQVIPSTDSNGHASAVVTLGNIAGPVQVTATAGTITATFNLAVVVPSTGIVKLSGDNQSTVINTAFAASLVVEVLGSDGNGIAGAIVNFTVTTGSATLGAPTGTSGANGQVSTPVTAGADAGPITITATTASFSVTFTLTARLPGPTNLAIVNGATFQTSTGISPGAIAIVTGVGILPGVQGLITANNFVGPLPTTFQGVNITFAGVSAPIYYVMNSGGVEQVAVQVPFETLPAGTTTVTNVDVIVTAASGTPATISVPVKPFAPGIFSTTSGGQTYAVAVRPDGSYVSADNPAQLGENITLYVTGLGPVTPAAGTGAAGILGQAVGTQACDLQTYPGATGVCPMRVGLSNSGVPIIAADYAPGMVGVYTVTFHVPANSPTGPAQPLAVVSYDSAGHVYFSQGITIPVQ